MSTSSPRSTPAPWGPLLTTHLSQAATKEFTLSTVTLKSKSGTPAPHARTVGFRGFFPSPPLTPQAISALRDSGDGLNPDTYESDMLTFTTDVRMEKVRDIAEGAMVEGVFWVKEVMSQWRVGGRAVVVGGDGDGEERARGVVWEGVRGKNAGSEKGMVEGQGSKEQGGGGEWSWERMVTSYFANHSPVLRGSFKSPPPGTPKAVLPSDPSLKLGHKLEDLHDPVARQNFRVVVIIPEVVERLDLTDYENPKRWRWIIEGSDGFEEAVKYGTKYGRWVEVEVWP